LFINKVTNPNWQIYVIVFFEKSTKVFHQIPDACLHYRKTVFDTGLGLELLQEYCLIALDVFRKLPYPKVRDEQSAWLSLLTTENPEDAKELISENPWLREIYEETAILRQKPEEVLGMFSEALRILDQNTVKYMIEELQKQLEDKDTEKALIIKEKDAEIKERDAEIKERDAEIAELKRQLEAVRPD